MDLPGSFRCDCTTDFLRPTCYTKDPCSGNGTCLNGGTCTSYYNDTEEVAWRTCFCPDGFQGDFCQIRVSNVHPAGIYNFINCHYSSTIMRLRPDKPVVGGRGNCSHWQLSRMLGFEYLVENHRLTPRHCQLSHMPAWVRVLGENHHLIPSHRQLSRKPPLGFEPGQW